MFLITTPAVLFPVITLILLAYTAKLIHLEGLVRTMKVKFQNSKEPEILQEVINLKKRIYIIRNMQGCGVACLLFCSICMMLLFVNLTEAAKITFSVSLIMLLCSLLFCFREVLISANALKIQLKGMGEEGLAKAQRR